MSDQIDDEHQGLIPEDEVTELDPAELETASREDELDADEPVDPSEVGQDGA